MAIQVDRRGVYKRKFKRYIRPGEKLLKKLGIVKFATQRFPNEEGEAERRADTAIMHRRER